MSYLALYRKYRPTSFSELVGQNYVSEIIKNEILNDRVSHAYLFSGPRGTGKTSTAKIIARMLNCLDLSEDGSPCGKCCNCLNFESNNDIVEIDAASNNGVDEIRDLRDKVNLVPSSGKYKIYIIDEVHMLTTQAFNALLKTLEEPPKHIIFIFATTEIYKIPVTFISRCQKFQFSKFSVDDVVSRLDFIAKNEKIEIDCDALTEIARLSDGGLRDAINMLDQLASFKKGKIVVDDVYKLNGVVSYEKIYLFLVDIYNNNSASIFSFIESIDIDGNDMGKFLEDLILFCEDVLLYKSTSKSVNITQKQKRIEDISMKYNSDIIYRLIFDVNDLLMKIKNTSCAVILVTTFFLKFAFSIGDNAEKENNDRNFEYKINELSSNNSRHSDDSNVLKNTNSVSCDDLSYVISEKDKYIRLNNAFATASKEKKKYIVDNWNLVDNLFLNSVYSSVASMIRDVDVLVVGEGYIVFLAGYDSLVDRLYAHLGIIENLLRDAFECDYKVIFLTNDKWLVERKKYIDNVKNGVVYNIISLDDVSDNCDSTLDVDNSLDDSVNKLVSIFGNDVIEYN